MERRVRERESLAWSESGREKLRKEEGIRVVFE